MSPGRVYMDEDVIYTKFKKHYCPGCETRLQLIKVSKVVNSKSPEARNYNFSCGDGFLVGNVKFIWKEFYCPVCDRQFSVKKLKRIEREMGTMWIKPKKSKETPRRKKKKQDTTDTHDV